MLSCKSVGSKQNRSSTTAAYIYAVPLTREYAPLRPMSGPQPDSQGSLIRDPFCSRYKDVGLLRWHLR
jgi:hypothetical protein